MEVLIVSKTRMSGQFCCVGGLVLENNRGVRLLQPGGRNQPDCTPIRIGEIWDIDFVSRKDITPPHYEDVIVKRSRFTRLQKNLRDFLLDRIKPWLGEPENLFNGYLYSTEAGSGYICRSKLPSKSTGFWIPDGDLTQYIDGEKARYIYPSATGIRSLPYVGIESLNGDILAGTLLRVSLARWWKPSQDPNCEERCYLQLSGWYLSDKI